MPHKNEFHSIKMLQQQKKLMRIVQNSLRATFDS